MQKGFTLVELLIVVVIVGVMVAIALPQYKRATERGRMMEGIANLRAVTDYMNTRYVLDDAYPTSLPSSETMGLVKSNFFDGPTMQKNGDVLVVYFSRKSSSGWNYVLLSFSQNGEITSSKCESGNSGQCKGIGLTGAIL